MGNSLGRSKKAKVMKIDGEIFKVKTPAIANDVVKDHPGHVLLDSQAVKYFGLRAKPLEPHKELKPKNIYFLVELPKIQTKDEDDDDNKGTLNRRVRSSGISRLNAKERLDLLMLSKRSVSDFGVVRQLPSNDLGVDNGPMRVKMRIPKAQLEKMMEETNDRTELAEKIMSLYMGTNSGGAAVEDGGVNLAHHLNSKRRGKRVSFSPMEDSGEIYFQAASQ